MEARDAAHLLTQAAGRGAALKVGVAGSVIFFVFLLLIGLLGAGHSGTAYADSCGKRGEPNVDLGGSGDDAGQKSGGNTRKQQIANAKIIHGVAEENKLPGRATLVGLMTALQESTLLNLDHGHADSVGLFQQRASWGSAEDRMNPKKAATMFYFGGQGGAPGLTDIRDWQSKPLGDAAQAVQKSAYPDLYAGQEDLARKIAKQADINLDRKGKGDEYSEVESDGGNQAQDQKECYQQDNAGEPGKPFHDGDAPWPSKVNNPRSTQEAIKWAKNEADTGGDDWYRLCLAFVAKAYGWNYSGVQYAQDHYHQAPANMQHDKGRNPPPGALMYWDTGQRAGHVAVYLGEGKVASNDIKRPGYIDVVPATQIEKKWGATYLGWTPPYFPKGG